LEDEDYRVKLAVLDNPNVTAEHIAKAFDDWDYMLKKKALNHPNITLEQIDSALYDSRIEVRETAVCRALSKLLALVEK
jgi:hypothetical protein